MIEQAHEQELITESSAARLAYYFAFVPLAGFLFYMVFAFLGLVQIGKGRTGFYRLRNGLVAVFFFSILPIAGLVWWAELPQRYYLVLKSFTRHGLFDSTNNQGQTTQREYFRFGQSFRRIEYRYHDNGQLRSEAHYNGDKLNGAFSYWYDSGKPRLIETFVNNRRHGLTSWFDKDGKIERTMNYVNGISQEQIDSAKKAGVEPVIEVDLGGGVKMRMIFIPPGEFMMGSTEAEIAKVSKEANGDWYKREAPQHKVTLKQGFYLCETEVTQAQWKMIAEDNPSLFKGNNNPVENVSWDDIQECLKKLNTQDKGTFRLPSEAEWEYSARSGTATSFGFGDDYAVLGDYDWYGDNSGNLTHPASGKKANNFGLYDIHGNVWEWVEDDYHDNYQGAPNDGKAWLDSPRGAHRVSRGGSWGDDPWNRRSASRLSGSPGHRYDDIGFRLLRTLSK